MGKKVIYIIFAYYFLLYMPVLFVSIFNWDTSDLDKNQRIRYMFGILANWYRTPYIFSPSPDNKLSPLFMVSYMLTSVMLFTQGVIILHVARENFIVFWDEHSN